MVEYEADATERTVVERVDPRIGTVLAERYRLDERLAEGGFGAVYRATHLPSGAVVAVKVLHSEHARDAAVVARFRREGAVLANLTDPHTITAYEIGEAAGTLFIAMELLRGENLYDRFTARGAMPWQDIVAIAREVCSSLAEAHALGIIHRDLKPSNIHLEPRPDGGDFVKVIDFGIAKLHDQPVAADLELTHQGQMIGTFDYMSPEQMIGGTCTAASDIYTLGVVMYEMITGLRPFPDETGPASMLSALLTKTAPPMASHRSVPAELDAVVMRCLAREPAERFASIGELADALDRLACEPAELAVTQLIPFGFPQPVLPLPAAPASGFEACGSEAGIASPRYPTQADRARYARRVALAFCIVLIVAITALVVATI